MDEKYIAERLDDVHDRLSDIDKTLAVNTELLAIHIKRTDLLEQSLKIHQERTAEQMEEALLPVKFFRFGVSVSKIASALAAVGSGIYAAIKYLRP